MTNARAAFDEELAALKMQVEVMAILVGEAVEQACIVVTTGDRNVAAAMIAADDAIDEMQVSLTEACYLLLAREAPVASDLRLVVSVIRVLHTLERIGDLALRIANAVDDQPLVASHDPVMSVLSALAGNVSARYVAVRTGWSTGAVEPLAALDELEPLAEFANALIVELVALDGPEAVRVALAASAMGRSLDRIGDHTHIMASRLRYLVTGDPAYLADEVAW